MNPLRTKEGRLSERAHFARMYADYQLALTDELPDGSEVKVYTREQGRLLVYLVAFAGTSGKPTAHHSFRSVEAAKTWAGEWLDGRRRHIEMVETHQHERTAYRTTLEPGRILVDSWGYDQTNIDYYQVVEVSPTRKTVTIRPIASRSVDEGWLRGACWPLKDEFTGPPAVKRIGPGDSVKVREWGSWAHPWTPKADRWTAYH